MVMVIHVHVSMHLVPQFDSTCLFSPVIVALEIKTVSYIILSTHTSHHYFHPHSSLLIPSFFFLSFQIFSKRFE